MGYTSVRISGDGTTNVDGIWKRRFLTALAAILVWVGAIPLYGCSSSGEFTRETTIYTDWGFVLKCKVGDKGVGDSSLSWQYGCYKRAELNSATSYVEAVYIDMDSKEHSPNFRTEEQWIEDSKDDSEQASDRSSYKLEQCGTQKVSGMMAHIYKETYYLTYKPDGHREFVERYYCPIETEDTSLLIHVYYPNGDEEKLLREFLRSCEFSHI